MTDKPKFKEHQPAKPIDPVPTEPLGHVVTLRFAPAGHKTARRERIEQLIAEWRRCQDTVPGRKISPAVVYETWRDIQRELEALWRVVDSAGRMEQLEGDEHMTLQLLTAMDAYNAEEE